MNSSKSINNLAELLHEAARLENEISKRSLQIAAIIDQLNDIYRSILKQKAELITELLAEQPVPPEVPVPMGPMEKAFHDVNPFGMRSDPRVERVRPCALHESYGPGRYEPDEDLVEPFGTR